MSCEGDFSSSVTPLTCVLSKETRGQSGSLPTDMRGSYRYAESPTCQIHLGFAYILPNYWSSQIVDNEAVQIKPWLSPAHRGRSPAEEAAPAGGESFARLSPSSAPERTGSCRESARQCWSHAPSGPVSPCPRGGGPQPPVGRCNVKAFKV